MAYKVYISGNAFKIESFDGEIKHSHNRKDVRAFRTSNNDNVFVFSDNDYQYFSSNVDNLANGNGDGWVSADDFEQWCDDHLGCCGSVDDEYIVYSEDLLGGAAPIVDQEYECARLIVEFLVAGTFGDSSVAAGFKVEIGDGSKNSLYKLPEMNTTVLNGKIRVVWYSKANKR